MPTPLELSSASEDASCEVQDLMGSVPHSIVRWGISLILCIVLVLLGLSWMVRYPDVIASRISITSENPPASVVAPIRGRLARLAVADGQAVTNGSVLAIIEGAAASDSVFRLQRDLDHYSTRWLGTDELPIFPFDQTAHLGELQPAYSEFLTSYRQSQSLAVETNHAQKISLLEKQVAQTRDLIASLRAQQHILERERELAERQYERIRALAADKVQSASQVAEAESVGLAKQRECAAAENASINAGIQVLEYEKAIRDLTQQRDEQRRQARLQAQESFKKLRAEADQWELQHVLKAPVDGKVALFKFWSPSQQVQAQEEVMTVVPEIGRLLGRITLKERGAGKIRRGQSVRVKLDDFPSHEYGFVTAIVESLSLVPRDNAYLVNLRFDAGLKTSYGRTLRCKQEMQGEADIITEKRRLIERIFYAIRHLALDDVEAVTVL